jgi:hypothetical protein
MEAQKALYNILCEYKLNLNFGLKEKLTDMEYRDISKSHDIKPENDEGNNKNFEKIIKATLKALLDQLDSLVRSFITFN